MSSKYISKTDQQLKNWLYSKKREGRSQLDFKIFKNWYDDLTKVCNYCGLSEIQSQLIVKNGLLKSKRFPQDGLHGRGTSRGMWLEIDRYDPNGLYEVDNMVLCCYFCNNDKSDVFHGDDYRKFMKDRIGFLKRFL